MSYKAAASQGLNRPELFDTLTSSLRSNHRLALKPLRETERDSSCVKQIAIEKKKREPSFVVAKGTNLSSRDSTSSHLVAMRIQSIVENAGLNVEIL